jgi:pimeloyl-ACP methyl ester carboxylesterase
MIKVNDISTEPHVPPPSPWLALTEVHRAFAEIVSLNLSHRVLAKSPNGDGHPVMILPGFMGGDGYNAPIRRFLKKRNYEAHGWGLGRNLGPRNGVVERLEASINRLCDKHGGPVSLVGHSLGGIYAREIARIMPDSVRQVISLGSPFGEGRQSASYPARVFRALNPLDELPLDQNLLADAPPVPTTSVYSHGDGIVNWVTSVQSNGHLQTQNIRIRGSHCGMTVNPTVWFLVAERLAQEHGQWQAFEPKKWASILYPAPVHDAMAAHAG